MEKTCNYKEGAMIKKIVIIGPESTGKSTLCSQLAAYYNTLWCPEYAREYLLRNGTTYTFDDLATVARGQLKLEDSYLQKVRQLNRSGAKNYKNASTSMPPLLFLDTDMYVMKVWCEFVFGKCHQFILDEIVRRTPHLFLLCNTDLPWVKDELREYPDLKTREILFHMYKDLMVNQSTPWVEIKGDAENRLNIALEAVNQLLSTVS